MQSYELNFTNTSIYNSDVYINLSYVEDESFFSTRRRPIISNIDNYSLFVDDLLRFEKNQKSGRSSTDKICYGVLLKYQLPYKTENKNELISMAENLVESYSRYPYFVYITEKGDAQYINLYICEREYYVDGIMVKTYAKSDRYRNSKTGKMCMKDCPDAVLYKKEGEVISEKFTIFSSKTQKFHFSGKESFVAFMNTLKEQFISICERVMDVLARSCYTIKRFIIEELSDNQRSAARIWNQAFRRVEDSFALLIQEAALNDKLSSVRGSLDKFVYSYHQHMKQRFYDSNNNWVIKFNAGHKIRYEIDLSAPLQEVRQATELFQDQFLLKLQEATKDANLIVELRI